MPERSGLAPSGEVAYWRSGSAPLEAMSARFVRGAYHRHSHETYSFGVTARGRQGFWCRGETFTSVGGLVLAFNPDDPHDGHTVDELGFAYDIVHIGPDLVPEIAAEPDGSSRATLPLFREPLLDSPRMARALRRLHASLRTPASALARDEALARAISAALAHAHAPRRELAPSPPRIVARRARAIVRERFLDDISATELAHASGCSRFALYRAFLEAFGMTPADYQRQCRLRHARRLLAAGASPVDTAAASGFADQSHLNRWFRRYFGITPTAYRRSVSDVES